MGKHLKQSTAQPSGRCYLLLELAVRDPVSCLQVEGTRTGRL